MKKLLVLILCIIFASSCGVTVNYDYEKATDFSKYKTYNYYSNIKTGLSDLDTKRLFRVLDESLQNKGFQLSETPDFFIDIQSSEHRSLSRNTIGVGGGGSHVGGGVSVGIPIGQSNIDRQIQFDFVDENDVGLFWQAVSESSFKPNETPEKREARLKAIVEKVLKKFPPEL